MSEHKFILSSGVWIGEGRVTFSASPEKLRFYTKWTIKKEKKGTIICHQEVEMEGGEGAVTNLFKFSDITQEKMVIELSSEMLGTVMGKGIIDANTIGWEFRGHPEFEGFEVYELQENGDYMLHGEYASSDQVRTIIDGRIWKKDA